MTRKDIELAEQRITLASKKVQPQHLEYWLSIPAARGKGTDVQNY